MMLDLLLVCGLLLQDPVPQTPPVETPAQDPPAQAAPTNGGEPAAAPASTPATEPQNTPTASSTQDPPAQPTSAPTSDPTANPTNAVPAVPEASKEPTAAPVGPAPAADPQAQPLDPAAASIPPITEQDLADVLELAGMNAVSSLEREVKSLQQTLDGLVLADDESVVKIHGAKGAEDDLEGFGVDDAVARQVRRLLDEVKSKRAKLALLDLRGASSNNPNDGLRSVTDVAESAAAKTAVGATEANAPASAPAAVTAAPTAEPEDVLNAPSPDPQREALIAYRDRDVRTVLELLADTPMLRMKPLTLWAYGSCLMSERRYADAKPVFARLADERDHPQLAHGAKQQLARITFIENALVGQGPSTETTK